MKTIKYIFLFVSLSFFSQAQTIRRVTNDPNIPLGTNMYRTLQAAHDAATANDIIYVQSSYQGASYGDLSISKKLHIIGNGYSIEENKDLLGANAPHNTASSFAGNITINFGSDCIIEGLSCQSITSRNRVIIRRCNVPSIYLRKTSATYDASGSLISHNSTGSIIFEVTDLLLSPLTNVTIANNIIINITNQSFNTNRYDESYVNNIIIRNNYIREGISHITNAQLHSNILHGFFIYTTIYAQACPNIVASNNVCINGHCQNGTNNVNGPLEIQFFGYANGGSPTIPRHHILSNSSPAKGAGLGGVDAGPFGTADPFRLSGLPAIPQITSYSSQISNSIYTSSTPMNVTISVKGNN